MEHLIYAQLQIIKVDLIVNLFSQLVFCMIDYV